MKTMLSNIVTKIANQEDVAPAQLKKGAQRLLKGDKANPKKLQRLVERILEKPTITKESPLVKKFKPKHQKDLVDLLAKVKKEAEKAEESSDKEEIVEAADDKEEIDTPDLEEVVIPELGLSGKMIVATVKKEMLEGTGRIKNMAEFLDRVAKTKETEALLEKLVGIGTSEKLAALLGTIRSSKPAKTTKKALGELAKAEALATKKAVVLKKGLALSESIASFLTTLKEDKEVGKFIKAAFGKVKEDLEAFETMLEREKDAMLEDMDEERKTSFEKDVGKIQAFLSETIARLSSDIL